MPFNNDKHIILNKKSTKHLSAWKFDMSQASMKKGMDGGITFFIDSKTQNSTELKNFLINHLNVN
jgi:hypothetical protein